jgi:hypothetical protein
VGLPRVGESGREPSEQAELASDDRRRTGVDADESANEVDLPIAT